MSKCPECGEEVNDEQEELDAIERPASQARIQREQEQDAITLANIQARFASPATSADVRNAVQAFKDGFEELDNEFDWRAEQ